MILSYLLPNTGSSTKNYTFVSCNIENPGIRDKIIQGLIEENLNILKNTTLYLYRAVHNFFIHFGGHGNTRNMLFMIQWEGEGQQNIMDDKDSIFGVELSIL